MGNGGGTNEVLDTGFSTRVALCDFIWKMT